MNKKRWGLASIILSAIISLSNLTITGAVVGAQTKNYLSLFSIFLFVIGFVLLSMPAPAIETGLPKIIETPSWQKSIRKHRPDPKKVTAMKRKLQVGLGSQKILPQ